MTSLRKTNSIHVCFYQVTTSSTRHLYDGYFNVFSVWNLLVGLLTFPFGDSITMCCCGWGRVINEPSDFIVSLDDESEEHTIHSFVVSITWRLQVRGICMMAISIFTHFVWDTWNLYEIIWIWVKWLYRIIRWRIRGKHNPFICGFNNVRTSSTRHLYDGFGFIFVLSYCRTCLNVFLVLQDSTCYLTLICILPFHFSPHSYIYYRIDTSPSPTYHA